MLTPAARSVVLAGSRYVRLRNAAIAAARANNASLWFAGAPSDLAGFVWQDSAGAVPATGTDPIGRLTDRAGSNAATQATAANKPTLELQANGFFGMRFDGTSDFLDATFPASSTAGTQVISILTPASPPAAFAVAYSAGTGGPQLFQNSSGQWLIGPNGGATVNMGVQANASSRVFSAVLQSGTLSGRVNGGAPVTAGVAAYSGTTALVIGAQNSTTFFAGIRLFLLCISTSAMPDADRIAIERFAALLSGANYP